MGHPKLRAISKEIELSEIHSKTIQDEIDGLIDTMRLANGAGIAAPQVGIMNRIFIMGMNNNPRYPDQESFPLLVSINPKIKELTNETVEGWEGCLSIPDIRGKVNRFTKIELTAYDRNGELFKQKLEGFAAVVAQHELDHLNGVLFIDRMTDLSQLSFHKEYLTYHK